MRFLRLAVLIILSVSFFTFIYAEEETDLRLEEYLKSYSDAYFSAQYQKAIGIADSALNAIEKKFGPNHPNVAAMLANLAALNKIQSRFSEAEKLYKRSLEIYESTLGLDNPFAAKIWVALGENYQARHKYIEAESCYKNSKIIWEKNFGPENPNTNAALTDLGDLYRLQHKYAEAEAMLKRSLEITATAYGQGHPVLIRPLSILGLLYNDQGKTAEAEHFFKFARGIFKGNFTREEPTIESAVNRLKAEINRIRSQRDEPIYKRIVDLNDLYIGPWHQDAPKIIDNLPALYLKEERYTEAENIYQDSLELMLSNLGPDHLNIVKTLNNMEKFYRKIGEPEKAKEAKVDAQTVRAKAGVNK